MIRAAAPGRGPVPSGGFNLDDRQRKAQPQLIAEINLDVMQSKLLELHAAEIMDVGRVAFHFLQVEIDLRLRDRVGVIRADDLGALMKPSAPLHQRVQMQSRM